LTCIEKGGRTIYSTTNRVELKYGYDYSGNRLWSENLVSTTVHLDELYSYAELQRLKTVGRGDLNSGHTAFETDTQTFAQEWNLDALGNWKAFCEDAGDGSTWDLDQSRLHNSVNEIDNNDADDDTPSGSIVGGSWALPEYDEAGNMTDAPTPGNETVKQYYVYDAWNRLVEVRDSPSNAVGQYEYDGMGRRIVKYLPEWADEAASVHFYYNGQQVVEERAGTVDEVDSVLIETIDHANPLAQYVWHPYYIDALAVRYYDSRPPSRTNTTSTTRTSTSRR